VLLPALQADPAEVVPALGALDVVAAVRLLDGRAAVRAGLGVGHQPEEVGSFVIATYSFLIFNFSTHLETAK